jgi:hypothetical protein
MFSLTSGKTKHTVLNRIVVLNHPSDLLQILHHYEMLVDLYLQYCDMNVASSPLETTH